jgi:hypothetical protein
VNVVIGSMHPWSYEFMRDLALPLPHRIVGLCPRFDALRIGPK